MDQTRTINRYRNLLVICVLLILALFVTLFDLKNSQVEQPSKPVATVETVTSEPKLFRIGDQQFGYDQLPAEFQAPLYQIRKLSFEQQMLVIEQAIVDTYIHQKTLEAANTQQAMKKIFPELNVSDDEVLAYYEENRNDQTPPFETLKPQLAEYLLSLKQEQAKKQLLAKILVAGEAQVLFEAPKPPAQP